MNNSHLKLALFATIMLFTRCGMVVVLLSPSKQKKPGFNTSVPKVDDFQYSTSHGLNGTHYFSSQNLFIAEDINCLYREMNNSLNCNLKQGYEFWPDVKCYAFGLI